MNDENEKIPAAFRRNQLPRVRFGPEAEDMMLQRAHAAVSSGDYEVGRSPHPVDGIHTEQIDPTPARLTSAGLPRRGHSFRAKSRTERSTLDDADL